MFSPYKVGATANYLASKYLEVTLQEDWWELTETPVEDGKEICSQILELYDDQTEQVVKMKKATSEGLKKDGNK
jgi:hypothetical protein